MSVPKGKRTQSPIEFYIEAYKLHKELLRYLLNDFGIKKSSYDFKVFMNRTKMSKEDAAVLEEIMERNNIEVESDYCKYIVYHYRDAIIELLDAMIDNITLAYSIFPNTESD